MARHKQAKRARHHSLRFGLLLALIGMALWLCWRITYDHRPPPTKLRPIAVVDAGHGAILPSGIWDTGAIRYGLREADVVLDIAYRCQSHLERRGWVAVLTRDTAVTPFTLAERTALAERINADVFVSLHLNSYPSPQPHGVTVFYWSPQSQPLAALLQTQLSQRLGLRDRGIERGTFTVLVTAAMPAVLVELGFLSNPQDAQKLRNPQFRERAAIVLAETLTAWWGAQREGQERRVTRFSSVPFRH